MTIYLTQVVERLKKFEIKNAEKISRTQIIKI